MILVQTEEQFHGALKVLKKASHIAFDTETYGRLGERVRHPAQGNRLIGISTHCIFPDNDKYSINFYFPFRHQFDDKQINLFTVSENLPIELLPLFAEVLNRDDLWLIFHHLKFDCQMFRADGLLLDLDSSRVIDTLAKGQMVDENMSHRLKDMGAMAFGSHVRHEEDELHKIIKKQGGFHKTTPQQMCEYACRDAQLTHDINPLLDKELEHQGLTHLVPREMKFQTVLMEMEWDGIKLDKDLAVGLSKLSRRRMRELEDKLQFDPQRKILLADKLFDNKRGPIETRAIRKHQKVERINFMKLPGGGEVELTKSKSTNWPDGIPKMDKEVLVNLRDPIADMVLEYRGLAKADSTWYQGWIKRMGSDGCIHPMYNYSDKKAKYGTVTSRLSSYIQQMPRDDDAMVKLLLRPEPGYVMAEFDYSQIEYREAACYAKDEILIEQFRAGVDTHQELANELKIDRQSAKQLVYTLVYGGQAPALAMNLMKQIWQNEKKIVEVTIEEAQEIINAYYKLHPKILQVAKRAEQHARKHGYVNLWNGRKRHFYKHEPWTFRKAFNSVLQGGAAQIIVESMLMLHDMRETEPFRMRLQVHDSLWLHTPEDNFDRHAKVITETMEWPGSKFPVPFPVEHKIIRGYELNEKQLAILEGKGDRDVLSDRSWRDDGVGSF